MKNYSHISITNLQKPHELETLTVNFNKKLVSGKLNGISFIDNDTKQQVFFLPSLDISGYGNTLEEAQNMVIDTVDDFFQTLLDSDIDVYNFHLKSLGWNKDKLFNKRFSKVSVDAKGQLHGFNVQENSIQTVGMIAA